MIYFLQNRGPGSESSDGAGRADEEEELDLGEMVQRGEVAWLDREDAPGAGAEQRLRLGPMGAEAEGGAGQARAQQAQQRGAAPPAIMQQGMQVSCALHLIPRLIRSEVRAVLHPLL